nr:reverse transcriptase domain-containing protein [Tanacetum cinerariifolium]
MTDNRTMAKMLRAPTEGCAEAIVVPPILAEQLELKHSLINMMTLKQFFRVEKDNPHDHIRWGSPPVAQERTPVVTTAMTAMLKQFQSNPPPAQVKAVEEIFVTCGGAHPYYQCLAAGGNTFPDFRDNIQGYVSAAAGNYNQGNPGYRPQGVANQMRPPGAHPYYQCLVAGGNTFPEYRDNIQGYVSTAIGNFNQSNPGYRPQGVANQMRPPGFAQPNV